NHDANRQNYWHVFGASHGTCVAFDIASADRSGCFRAHRASGASCLRAASLPRTGVYLDARILGLWGGRILLGARHMGDGASGGPAVDARLLGLERRSLSVACRLLGTARGILRRN